MLFEAIGYMYLVNMIVYVLNFETTLFIWQVKKVTTILEYKFGYKNIVCGRGGTESWKDFAQL